MNTLFHCPDAQALLRLLSVPNTLLEIRSLHPQQAWHFAPDALPDALTLLERHSGQRPLYACLNPLRPDFPGGYAQDSDITALRWFPLDADPSRPTDTASTDTERAAAQAVLSALLDFLRTHIPALDNSLVLGDSGNGFHALLRLPDYPPHGDHQRRSTDWQTLKRLHTALCKHFSTPGVKLDRSILNPARIWRIYGTLNLKGDDTPDRPRRLARLLTPEDFAPQPLDLLPYADTLLAALAPGDQAKTFHFAPSPPLAREGGDLPLEARGLGPAFTGPAFTGPAFTGPAFTGPAFTGPASLPPWWTEIITPGDRNNAAYRRARWLINPTEGNNTEEDAWDELQAWNKVTCRPRLEETELRQAFDSARTAGANPDFVAPLSPPLAEGEAGWGSKTGDAPWPKPLAEEAYYGLAGEIVHAIEPHTEADSAALLVQLLVAFGSAIKRGPCFTIEDTPHYTNLFAVIVGKSAIARKGTSWGRIRAVMNLAAPQWAENNISSGLSSGEGLIHAVRDMEEKQEPIKEKGVIKGYQTVVVDEGVADKRLLVMEGEFAGVLKQTERDGNILSVIVRNAFDGHTLQTLTKSRQRATDAHISIIGHITVDELRRYLSSTEAANGFANRFLWVCAKRSKVLPFGGRPDAAEIARLSHSLSEALTFATTVKELVRDADADAIWAEVYPDLPRETPGLLGSVITRAGAIVMRLSLIYALLDRSQVIRRPHLLAALAVWQYAEASCRYIFGDSLGDPLADDLLRRLRLAGAGGLSRTDISNGFGRHKDTNQLSRALDLLLEHRRIRHERTETGGRPQDQFFAL